MQNKKTFRGGGGGGKDIFWNSTIIIVNCMAFSGNKFDDLERDS